VRLFWQCVVLLHLFAFCPKGTCHPPSPLYVSRAAALAAGIPDHVSISTINRLCSSGLMAIRTIAHDIQSGETSLGVAVGVESMSQQSVHLCFCSRPFLPYIIRLSARPTPAITDTVSAHHQAYDCIQVWLTDICRRSIPDSRHLLAYGMDVRDGSSDVQGIPQNPR